MKKYILLTSLLGSLLSASADPLTFQLAQELLSEKRYDLSAVEFRRFAMETDQPSEQAAAYLYSSYAYLQSDQGPASDEMLDRAEDADGATFLAERTLLSAEGARMQHDPDTALYYYEVLADTPKPNGYQVLARRRSAAIHLEQGDPESAQQELDQSPSDESRGLQAIDTFVQGSNKSPMIGGLLGLIPGGGYWYTGEVANGVRSLLLNSLFMFGMYQTASDEQWGAFGIITFFEITWYSGSIYGGIDAAQRYNQNRLDSALDSIEGNLSYRPDPEVVVPLFKLNIHF